MRKFPAIVIGLGKIGQGYDYDLKDDSRILTHAAGFASHDAYDLVAGVDPDVTRRGLFEAKFGRPAYPDISYMFSAVRPEVVSIAVPTPLHYESFREVVQFKPRAVLCEKPIAACLKDGEVMVELAEKNECALAVNYMRRYEPGVIHLKQAIQEEVIGKIYKGVVWYSKGFLNNGSHFVDLLLFLLGNSSVIDLLNKGRKFDDNDFEPDVFIRFGDADIYLLSVRKECFFMNNMELIGTEGKISYVEGGNEIEIRKKQPHPEYPGYTILSQEKQIIPNDLRRYQWHVLEHLKNHLSGSNLLNSNGNSAVETLNVVESVFSLLR